MFLKFCCTNTTASPTEQTLTSIKRLSFCYQSVIVLYLMSYIVFIIEILHLVYYLLNFIYLLLSDSAFCFSDTKQQKKLGNSPRCLVSHYNTNLILCQFKHFDLKESSQNILSHTKNTFLVI